MEATTNALKMKIRSLDLENGFSFFINYVVSNSCGILLYFLTKLATPIKLMPNNIMTNGSESA